MNDGFVQRLRLAEADECCFVQRLRLAEAEEGRFRAAVKADRGGFRYTRTGMGSG